MPAGDSQPTLSVVELRGPFFVAEARDAGVSWRELQGKAWQRLSRGQYAPAKLIRDPELELRAVERRLPPEAAFSGPTAAWVLGHDLPPCSPIEVTVSREVPIRARAGLCVRRAALSDEEVIVWRGHRITSPLRTAADLGGRSDLIEGVVALDMMVHGGAPTLEELRRYVIDRAGCKGVARLRRALDYSEPAAESTMETRLRMRLVKGRLPRPQVQVELRDDGGRVLGRVDLFYPQWRLAIEYDGAHHADSLPADLRRQVGIVNAGYRMHRVTAVAMLDQRGLIAGVRRAAGLRR